MVGTARGERESQAARCGTDDFAPLANDFMRQEAAKRRPWVFDGPGGECREIECREIDKRELREPFYPTFPGGGRGAIKISFCARGNYEGGFRHGKRHGHGVLTFPDGRRYEGEWSDDDLVQVVMVLPDGQRIEGERCDYWRDVLNKGHEGEWREGSLDGQGLMTAPDGRRYEGGWRDGEYHGRGVITWPDGRRYEGDWRDGVFVGE